MNDFSGVIGVFNCQGAGWCRVGKKNLIHDEQPGTITGTIRANDINYLPKVADGGWTGDTVVFSHIGGLILALQLMHFLEHSNHFATRTWTNYIHVVTSVCTETARP